MLQYVRVHRPSLNCCFRLLARRQQITRFQARNPQLIHRCVHRELLSNIWLGVRVLAGRGQPGMSSEQPVATSKKLVFAIEQKYFGYSLGEFASARGTPTQWRTVVCLDPLQGAAEPQERERKGGAGAQGRTRAGCSCNSIDNSVHSRYQCVQGAVAQH